MTVPFTRALGAESGVQLNPLRDASEIPTLDNYDQVFALMMRSTRGRIDKPFKVNRGNVLTKLGKGEAIRILALNEAWVHVVEALNNGAYEAVIQRLVTSSAVISYAVASLGTGAALTATVTAGGVTSVTAGTPGTGYTVGQAVNVVDSGAGLGAVATVATINTNGGILTVTVSTPGTGYVQGTTTVTVSNPISFYVSATLPTAPYLFAVKHLECFNDGILVEFHADIVRSGGTNVINDNFTLRIRENLTNNVLYEFYGSLSPTSIDDFGNSDYMPDVVASQTTAVEVTFGGTILSLAPTLPCYGYDANGIAQWSKSSLLVCFTEGGTSYLTADLAAARVKLQLTPFNYAYISSGGTQSAGVVAQLIQLAYDTDRQLRMDIPGNLTPDAAVTYIEAFNLGGNANSSHLIHVFWSPLKSIDPTGLNGKGYIGMATLNIAYACGRNAQTNAKGFAPKNYVVAGRQWPINRMGITQTYSPTDQELNSLARAKINPCLFESYTGGGRYVFRDSLTSALVDSSLKKLISVADMSTTIDLAVTTFGKDVLQLPMEIAVKKMKGFLQTLFEDAESSDWLVPSADPFMEGKSFKYLVAPNSVRPYDRMDVSFWIRYDGTVRQIFVTQTLSK